MSKIIKCKVCNEEIGANAKVCPKCGSKNKKPFYKKWWFWVIAVVIVISVFSNSNNTVTTDINKGTTLTQEHNEEPSQEPSQEPIKNQVIIADFSIMNRADIEAWAETNKIICEFIEEYSDTIESGFVISQSKNANESIDEGSKIKIIISKGKKPSVEFQNALKKAETYSKMMHMSKRAIYDQLTSEYGERFPADAAQYAIDNLKADYNANALEKAKTYQETMNMSKSAIYDQLVSQYGEQFTESEAQYAIDHLDN